MLTAHDKRIEGEGNNRIKKKKKEGQERCKKDEEIELRRKRGRS
jgi:hypothetical protein